MPTTSKPTLYNPRHPERTLLYQTVLEHIGVEPEPPHITPARGPPLWDGAEAQAGEGAEPAPAWDEAAQPAPDFEVDQRISW